MAEARSSFLGFDTGAAAHKTTPPNSCQFSLSYDQGKTFAVIASIIGGCPTAEAYTIPIPKDVPAGTKALFAWTWQNLGTPSAPLPPGATPYNLFQQWETARST